MMTSWASYQIRTIAGCACTGNAANDFPRGRLQRKPLASDPDMHHDTCVTHVPWCMSGSLTRGGGENVPGIPGSCTTTTTTTTTTTHTHTHTQKTSNAGFDVFYDISLNKRLNKQSSRRWFETSWCSLWRHCYVLDCFQETWKYIAATVISRHWYGTSY